MLYDLLFQMFLYSIFGLLIILSIGVMFKGFFLNYIRVRISFGKYLIVKVRTPLRDYFKIGWVAGNFLCYKRGKEVIRMAITKEDKVFYRAMSVTWVDVDESTNSLCSVDYSIIGGYDAEKMDNLLVRALTRPKIRDTKEIFMFIMIGIAIVGIAIVLYLQYIQGDQLTQLTQSIPNIIRGSITQATNNLN